MDAHAWMFLDVFPDGPAHAAGINRAICCNGLTESSKRRQKCRPSLSEKRTGFPSIEGQVLPAERLRCTSPR